MDAKPFMSRDDHDAEFAASKFQKPISEIFDEQGNLRQTLPQEEKKEFEPDAEAEHLRRIMTSRDVAIRDAWTVLKQQKGFPYRDVRQDMVAEEYRKREAEKQLDDLRRRMTEPRTGPAAGNA